MPPARIAERGVAQGMNFRRVDPHTLGLSLDETSTRADVEAIWRAFGDDRPQGGLEPLFASVGDALPDAVRRRSAFLTHPTFNRYHSETEMLRLPAPVGRPRHRARPRDDPAGLVHDEAQRDLRNDSRDVAGVRRHPSVRPGGSDGGLSRDRRGPRGACSAR
jgi:hypothetical protein